MAFPLTYHRITNSDFRLCSTRRSRSQAGLYVYTHCMVSIHAEPTFERLRYILGGDRPSQTARLTVSPDPIQGRRLETQQTKGGIPRMTPLDLTAKLLSLPPILSTSSTFLMSSLAMLLILLCVCFDYFYCVLESLFVSFRVVLRLNIVELRMLSS